MSYEKRWHWYEGPCRNIWNARAYGRSLGLPYPDTRFTSVPGHTDCLICLYHLGLYVPLSKLREHQESQRVQAIIGGNPCGLTPSYHFNAHGMHSESP